MDREPWREASSVPPYQQIATELAAEIERGDRPPGSRLPSINDLVQEHGVARGTAAKALNLLVEQGLAVQVTGMGTYVPAKS